jgi:hypothetical protein
MVGREDVISVGHARVPRVSTSENGGPKRRRRT